MMTSTAARVGVGTRFQYDGEIVEVVEVMMGASGNEVLLRDGRGQVLRLSMRELLCSPRARVIPEHPGPASDDAQDTAGVVLGQLTDGRREFVLERAAHIREVLTGYRSGSAELAGEGEPRLDYSPLAPLASRYAAKAAELGVGYRTVERWAADYQAGGPAGLIHHSHTTSTTVGRVDERWTEIALEVMVEHSHESRPSRTMVIARTNARVVARFGVDVVSLPARATAFRVLERLERQQPTFLLSTKRNRDIAERSKEVYGKLRPARPGEYMLMDTTRSDVFAMDPVTLRWVQAEISVAMDWYDRCITGLRVTPVSTKSIDASSTLYQAYRPPPAPADWPSYAVWPEHGIPRSVLLDPDSVDGPLRWAAGPAIVPDTIVIDHGQIYISEHLTSVCERLGISIQPARLRTGRDKGPVERFGCSSFGVTV